VTVLVRFGLIRLVRVGLFPISKADCRRTEALEHNVVEGWCEFRGRNWK